MSSPPSSPMASPTLGKPGEGAWSPASWMLDKAPFLLYTMPHCALLWGEQCNSGQGKLRTKGPL